MLKTAHKQEVEGRAKTQHDNLYIFLNLIIHTVFLVVKTNILFCIFLIEKKFVHINESQFVSIISDGKIY